MDVDILKIVVEGKEHVFVGSEAMIDFGQGLGPQGGVIRVFDGLVAVHGAGGTLTLHGGLLNDDGSSTRAGFRVTAPDMNTAVLTFDGTKLTLRGAFVLLDNNGHPTLAFDNSRGNLSLGGNETDGDLELCNQGGAVRIHLDAAGNSVGDDTTVYVDGGNGNITLGGGNTDGDLELRDKGGAVRIHLDAAGNSVSDDTTVYVDGANGDIILKNADCAEDFDVAEAEGIGPGTVVVIEDDGSLHQCREPYDTRVAGVISGAGGLRPGIVLDRQRSQAQRMPVALSGKVYCKVDAQYAPIHIGDLLTTSPTSGHAMKAGEPAKAFGSVLGKALRSLAEGTGLIPVLVALQ